MESQPQNPEFKNNPENFHPCIFQMFFGVSFGNSVVVCYCFKIRYWHCSSLECYVKVSRVIIESCYKRDNFAKEL